jgi:hypothetical protein
MGASLSSTSLSAQPTLRAQVRQDVAQQWSNAWLLFHQPSQRRAWSSTLMGLNEFARRIPADATQTRALMAQWNANSACPLGDDVVRHPPSCLACMRHVGPH